MSQLHSFYCNYTPTKSFRLFCMSEMSASFINPASSDVAHHSIIGTTTGLTLNPQPGPLHIWEVETCRCQSVNSSLKSKLQCSDQENIIAGITQDLADRIDFYCIAC